MSAQAVDPGSLTPPGPALELHGPAYEWALWGTTVRLVTADPAALRSAKRLVDDVLAHVELAAGPHGEADRLPSGRWVTTSATLTALVAAGLERGLVGGLEVVVDQRLVRVAPGATLDVGVVARAWGADRCAEVVATQLDVACLVSIGGDIATAGPDGSGAELGWEVLVQHADGGPAALVAVPTGLALATAAGVDGDPWSAATVVAPDAVAARGLATGLVRGRVRDADGWPARLVPPGPGAPVLVGDWPEGAEL
ncbi:FAD:protein FMN transferase [Lapillicoccus jejuensis]|uniref:Thiamine biosynthesis lipoprotein ApbE n=1 Tax=Lapillicoccus jejuensis TaxID=402171 RepID=A0A542DY60_9MICO|nr:FAD:protein FMN transferase [Lapillicoccus jejuensis]TQJ08018.1 thiamine biosynthesis lipoprotein ApbE [Lapillicoccus jejuensis]